MKVSTRVRMSGPLVGFVGGFTDAMSDQGYTDLSLANQLRLMADLSRWLECRGRGASELTSKLVEQFLAKRRRTHTQFLTWRAVAPLFEYLRSIGVVRAVAQAEPQRSEVLRRYEQYLVQERGVTTTTLRHRLQVANAFLRGREPSELTAADVTRFVDSYAGRPPSLPMWLTALRSLLRFLLVEGETQFNLVHAVPSAPTWRQTSLPQDLEPSQVSAVLATCDRRTTIGRRDYAALLLMVRLGLRAGEVATLTLDDLAWETGEIAVHGKGKTTGRLPMPLDIGEALVAYLRRRRCPSVETRALILRSRAPYRGATATMITAIAQRALRTAGIPFGCAHRLRHTAAT